MRWSEVTEKWSQKYKRSINCSNPKGFSQKAHCAGRKKTNEAFVKPQFDVEWDEAARYPEFQKIGKEAWIELAKTGKAITIKSAKGIENTDAADPDSFKSLDPAKQKRALAQLEKGSVEMPIVAVYSDGYKELVGGNTRLTAMMAQNGKATVWAFKVPDEVAELAENFADGKSKAKRRQMDEKTYHESLEEALGEIAPNTEIYVDMDGVLADFFGEWSKSQGVDNWKDIKDPAKAIGDIKSIEDFWLNLPILPKAKELLGLIKQVKGKYKICTSPLADDPRSEPHKREWVKKNLSFFPPEEVIVTHNKPQFAKQKDGTPNILIDDYGVNINAWEEAGGIGFKYKDYKFNRTAKAIKNRIEDPVEENFADGKKKGKSRPGRVKRAGASCNGSVTALRKRAKNSSGEKRRMYHWCANMKSGRKKK
jgi:5'(3')-deoxyribonucleotidase